MPPRVRSRQTPARAPDYAPILAGLILDGFDFATMGPLGLWLGAVVGGAVGWWLAPSFGFSEQRRWICALASGLYCMIPFTSFLPVATAVGVAMRLSGGEPPEARGAEVIDVDFRPVDRVRRDSDDDRGRGDDRDRDDEEDRRER